MNNDLDFEAYLAEVEKVKKPLSLEEEEKLLASISELGGVYKARVPEVSCLFERIYLGYVDLVADAIKKYSDRGFNLVDLHGEGFLGLCHAIESVCWGRRMSFEIGATVSDYIARTSINPIEEKIKGYIYNNSHRQKVSSKKPEPTEP